MCAVVGLCVSTSLLIAHTVVRVQQLCPYFVECWCHVGLVLSGFHEVRHGIETFYRIGDRLLHVLIYLGCFLDMVSSCIGMSYSFLARKTGSILLFLLKISLSNRCCT